MAKIFPSFDVIAKSKQKPTAGELFILDHLEKSFDEDVEIYFQPFFNGERPDIVMMHKIKGIIIIEVKDWSLPSYHLDENNNWYVKKNMAAIRSPFSQVFGYKKNMFELHINGLLKKNMENKNFYKIISCYLYFHCESKQSLKDFYQSNITLYQGKLRENEKDQHKTTNYEHYEKNRIWLKSRLEKLERDLQKHSVTKDQLKKIQFPLLNKSDIYTPEIYECFLRYLQPPYHYLNDGKQMIFTSTQERLSISDAGKREKIKGVAGSGKTTVLAKRAVNAHKRHGNHILILTFNLTLRMYIKDKISEVREDFSWGAFGIINYHRFIGSALSKYGLELKIPDKIKNDKEQLNLYLEKNYYSNETIFDNFNIKEKFDTILIDEIQDYKPEWIKIIRKHFLSENGEMVLFGDEKQNIYEREMDSEEKSTKVVQGFGRWNKLSKSFRYADDSHILKMAKEFQSVYFQNRYDLDFIEFIQPSLTGVGVNQCVFFDKNNLNSIVSHIFSTAKKEVIHPNDMTIISSNISQIRSLDYIIRRDLNFNERTLTTFESEEVYRSKKIERRNIEKIRSNKKYGFNLNSGVIKLSTIHSFKGYESPTVFLIVNDGDNEELIYVGLTRAKLNLVVFIKKDSKYSTFFKERLEVIDLTETEATDYTGH